MGNIIITQINNKAYFRIVCVINKSNIGKKTITINKIVDGNVLAYNSQELLKIIILFPLYEMEAVKNNKIIGIYITNDIPI